MYMPWTLKLLRSCRNLRQLREVLDASELALLPLSVDARRRLFFGRPRAYPLLLVVRGPVLRHPKRLAFAKRLYFLLRAHVLPQGGNHAPADTLLDEQVPLGTIGSVRVFVVVLRGCAANGGEHDRGRQ